MNTAISDTNIASPKTAILGFGNPVRSDDAIGVYVANKLQEHLQHHKGISVFDMGTSAFEVLFKLKGHDRIIIIDGVLNSGQQDGTLYCLPASEIKAQLQEDPLVFLHGMKWDQALSYAKKLMGKEFPENKIQVYLIAISQLSINLELSEYVRTAGDKLISTILKELSPQEKLFSTDCDVYLESGHICIRKKVAEQIFGSANMILGVFYAKDNTFMAAPVDEEIFKSIHKGNPQILKTKNASGDKSISIQEILLDNEIGSGDRELEFALEEAVHILKIKL